MIKNYVIDSLYIDQQGQIVKCIIIRNEEWAHPVDCRVCVYEKATCHDTRPVIEGSTRTCYAGKCFRLTNKT